MTHATSRPHHLPPQDYGAHAGALWRLGLPLIGSQVAQMLIHTTDMVMLGWYDVTALAGLVLGSTLFYVLFILGSGFAYAVMPLVAAAAGTDDDRQVRRVTRMAMWWVILYGVAMTLPLLQAREILLALGQPPEAAAQAGRYLAIAGFGLVPGLLIMVLRSYLSGLTHTRIVLWVTVAVALLNVPLNWLLIFGNWGFPELGIEGAAIASVLVQVAGFAGLAAYARMRTAQYTLFANFHRIDTEAFARVFTLGAPIGLTLLAEVGLFSASSVMMGWIGTNELAAHGIALQIASLTFMVHYGLSQAVTVRAGQAFGRGDAADLRAGALVGLAMSGGMVLFTVALFLLLPAPLIGLFLDPDDPQRAAIIGIGVLLLALAALFQLVDAAQVMALGMLRGVQDTRVPMVIAVFSYWAVGMPAAWLLAFPLGLGPAGIWLGLVIGLTVAALFLTERFWRRASRLR